MTKHDWKLKRTQPANWRSSLILVVIAAASTLGVAGCPVNNPNPGAPGLNFRAKLYASDAKAGSIVRKDAAAPGGYDVIQCESPRFENRVCVTVDEYKRHIQDLNDISYQCVQWRAK